ncbi:hypothetical protein F8388_019396 [Cannabis sativa]|uniref:Uncharacterized protein n=1 Tax=Cannabis sativa TaxID=3483 RepID=A0A7J6I9G8_CANSA|nr:hypothetical protein F8388_019396 [Cannabis sativa]KAF4403946.1 hypothetical protein G4B88_014402 [Cannabis sativa]
MFLTHGLVREIALFLGNILLLKNNLTLSPDVTEVSQEKLLSLVAERLIDSNSNIDVILKVITCIFVISVVFLAFH